jgi:pilus assembly protein CpaF
MTMLVRQALRMRPDRLVLGECRGAELGEFVAALNTGHGGGGMTLHANSLEDVSRRLEAVGLLAGLAPEVLARQAVTAFDAVVFLERSNAGRRVTGIAKLALGAGGILECAMT